MRLTTFTRTVMVTAMAVATAVAGVPGQAHAFSFSDTTFDVVVALYGGSGTQEALYNLGSAGTVFAGGPNQTLAIFSSDLAAVGTTGLKFTVFGSDIVNDQILGGTTVNPSSAPLNGNTNLINNSTLEIALNLWAPHSSFTGNTIAKTDPNSYSNRIVLSGPSVDNLGGSFPVNMFGNPGDVLNILESITGNGNLLQLGRVQLLLSGCPSGGACLVFGNPGPSAVPIPAAAVLFGTGLIGLVGVARRSFPQLV